MTLKAIIFDLDETLTDRRAAIDSFILRLIARYFPDSDEVTQLRIAKRFKEADHNGYRDKREVYEMLAEHLQWVNPPTADEYLTFFREEIPLCIQPMDQLFPVLRHLKSKGLRLGIITNGTVQVQEGKIRQLCLTYCLQRRGSSATIRITISSEHRNAASNPYGFREMETGTTLKK
jgi:putative hydrolase of the HAD superfamily